MSKIELGKTYRTRNGREVRIYAVDGGGSFPIHGAVLFPEGWLEETWTPDGKPGKQVIMEYEYDLIEVHPRIKREVWVNVYPDSFGIVAGEWAISRAKADENAWRGRIACIPLTIDCEEGEGL